MRTGALPFKFDLTNVSEKIHRIFGNHVGDVTLSLPFVSISVTPKQLEKKVAREIVIRLRDRRVLCAHECCDNCIDQALESLQEIRRMLIDKQVELADLHEGPLYFLTEYMLLGIRQFLTFEQSLDLRPATDVVDQHGSCRNQDIRQDYFDALEMLRAHLAHCLGQVATIADMTLPSNGVIAQYQGDWQKEAYLPPSGVNASIIT